MHGFGGSSIGKCLARETFLPLVRSGGYEHLSTFQVSTTPSQEVFGVRNALIRFQPRLRKVDLRLPCNTDLGLRQSRVSACSLRSAAWRAAFYRLQAGFMSEVDELHKASLRLSSSVT